MRRWFALTAIGHDRPGFVADLAELIYECDCNLEESRMTVLGSEFAVLLLCSGQGADLDRRLSAACKRLEWEKRLTVFVRPLEDAAAPRPPAGVPFTCEVTGIDRAGIVARVARTLADAGANVTDLRTEVTREPGAGTPIYTLQMQLVAPDTVDLAGLRGRLEQAAADLAVEVTLSPR